MIPNLASVITPTLAAQQLELARAHGIRASSLIPRPYQLSGHSDIYKGGGIQWLRDHKRAMLVDAPGLGKTFQASEAADLPCVVTTESQLTEQWADYLQAQYPNDRVVNASAGYNFMARHKLITQAGGWDWLVVNHDMFRSFYLEGAATVIADEFHDFRRRDAERSKNFYDFAQRTPRVIGLTATPIYKDISDLWHLLYILDPKKPEWSSYWRFITTFAVTSDYGFGTKVIRQRNKATLDRLTVDYMYGRTYKEVGMYLPPRIDEHIELVMTPVQLKQYKTLRDDYVLELGALNNLTQQRFFNAGAVLHKLRALTVTPEKIAAVKKVVDNTPGTAPILVGCMYHETADKLATALNAVKITGEIAGPQRQTLARSGKSRVIVATMGSFAAGVDLSDARTIIIVEETYIPGQQYQFMSRVQRARTAADAANDTTPVLCYWLRYKQTVDAVVHRKVRARISDAHDILKEALL